MKDKSTFKESELIRYKRQLLLEEEFGFSQEKLKKAAVFIAGAGGLGSPASMYLAAAGVGRIIICDNDVVELSNLNRQILHSTDSLGRKKSDSAGMRLTGINPEIKIETLSEKIGPEPDDLIGDSAIIIDCLDNIETRYHLNEYSMKTGIPIVHGGINGYAGQISFISPPETACLRCIFPEIISGSSPIPVIGAAAGIIGSMQAMEAVKFLTGSGDLLKNRLLIIDGYSWEMTELQLDRDPSCKACSAKQNPRS